MYFKKTLVVLCIAISSSFTSTIAQPELSLPHVSDLSPKKVQYFIVSHPVNKEVVYTPGITLKKKIYHTTSYLWFEKGTCTDYASSKRPELFNHNGKRLITGNAKEWLSKANELWFATGRSPKSWSIAVYLPGDDGASSYGHVAYVESVQKDWTIIISDMNYRWKNIVTKRTVSADSAAGYIY